MLKRGLACCGLLLLLPIRSSRAQQPAAPDTAPAPNRELIVRVLDVGQGDAIVIGNGSSRIIVDGGPSPARFGSHLDALGLNNSIIDVVILSHAHLDHYSGLRELFRTERKIRVRYFFENKDPSTAGTISILRDSILARMDRDSLIYRDTDDPCGDGRRICTVTMAGGAKLHIMAPLPRVGSQNNRSAAIKLVGPDSASFTMWLAGDAEHQAIRWFEDAGYAVNPGMSVNVLKAQHHGSCNGVTARYLGLARPEWVVVSLGASNGYGHMHTQARNTYTRAGIPWYRTDINGSITIRSPGTRGGGYSITSENRGVSARGSSDRRSAQVQCRSMR